AMGVFSGSYIAGSRPGASSYKERAKKVRAVRKSAGKERRWMRDINHKLSRAIVSHAQEQDLGIMRMEQPSSILRRTARKSHGAKARKNHPVIATWTFHQLATLIADTAERGGIGVAWIDPAHTSQMGPVCFDRNGADDRRSVCTHGGWQGRRGRRGR